MTRYGRPTMDFTLHKLSLPTASPLAPQAIRLLGELFGEDEVIEISDQFAGKETDYNEDTLYALAIDGQLTACCRVTRRKCTGMALLGDVACSPLHRGKGYSRIVCQFALNDFDANGGEFIWLCTSNPIAANLYESIGFHYLPGAHVMLRLKPGIRGTDVAKMLFPGGDCDVEKANPAMRVPMLPLISGRNRGNAIDSNVGILTTNLSALSSCAGLYPRFLNARARGGECVFLHDRVHSTVPGIGTILPQADGRTLADAFWRPEYEDQAPKLIRALQDAAGGKSLVFPVADDYKAALLLGLGARPSGDSPIHFGKVILDTTLYTIE